MYLVPTSKEERNEIKDLKGIRPHLYIKVKQKVVLDPPVPLVTVVYTTPVIAEAESQEKPKRTLRHREVSRGLTSERGYNHFLSTTCNYFFSVGRHTSRIRKTFPTTEVYKGSVIFTNDTSVGGRQGRK